MARQEKLRLGPVWEVDLVSVPEIEVDSGDLAGILMVVDCADGTLRTAMALGLGAALLPHVLSAASEPMKPLLPGRPSVIRCRAALAHVGAQAADQLGADLEVVEELPMLDEAAAAFREHFAGPPLLVPRDPEQWHALLQTFVRQAPWRMLSDSICFRFPAGSHLLAQAVAVVMGRAGTQRGLAVFPTERDYQRFLVVSQVGRDLDLGPWRCLALHLDPLDELSPQQRELSQATGTVARGLALLPLVFQDGELRAMDAAEEAACLLALRGVVGASQAHGERLCFEETEARVRTPSGQLTVTTVPGIVDPFVEPEPLLVEASHQVFFSGGGDQASLAIKLAKADARRLAQALQGVDALSLHTEGPVTTVVAWAGPRRLGVITDGEYAPDAWDHWLERGQGLLAISAGGAKRRGIRPQDILAVFEVELLEEGWG